MDAWELVRYSAAYDLAYHAGVKYNNRIITIGGLFNGVASNLIMESSSGYNAKVDILNPTGLPVRSNHAACVFDERKWVTGGLDGQTLLTDILFSRDGKSWETTYNAAEGLYDHRLVAFGNPRIELVNLGGISTSGEYINIIIHSPNGKHWSTVNTVGTMWSARAGFGALVYKNKLWVFGGTNGQDDYNDVWYTDDLIHWHLAIEHAPWHERAYFGYCEWDERMWVIAGSGNNYRGQGGSTSYKDVWFSRDGTAWEQAFDFPTELSFTYAEPLENLIHVAGGVGNEHSIYKMRMG
jgi:hypothetical protein